MVLHIREAAESEIRVSEIRFPHAARGPIAEYERALGAPVRFRQPDWAIALPTQALRVRLVSSNPEVARALRSEAGQQLEVASAESFRTRVEDVLRRGLAASSESRPEGIARLLAVSVRTLQRRLRDEGTSLREVRDGVREELARTLLADRSLRITDVAERLGYTDVAAFDNAFRRWTGETPTSFRRRSQTAKPR
jgi:AraC-like DNA-binding protein